MKRSFAAFGLLGIVVVLGSLAFIGRPDRMGFLVGGMVLGFVLLAISVVLMVRNSKKSEEYRRELEEEERDIERGMIIGAIRQYTFPEDIGNCTVEYSFEPDITLADGVDILDLLGEEEHEVGCVPHDDGRVDVFSHGRLAGSFTDADIANQLKASADNDDLILAVLRRPKRFRESFIGISIYKDLLKERTDRRQTVVLLEDHKDGGIQKTLADVPVFSALSLREENGVWSVLFDGKNIGVIPAFISDTFEKKGRPEYAVTEALLDVADEKLMRPAVRLYFE